MDIALRGIDLWRLAYLLPRRPIPWFTLAPHQRPYEDGYTRALQLLMLT